MDRERLAHKVGVVTIPRSLTSCFNVTQGFLPGMIERRCGRIVNVSSVTGPPVVIEGGNTLQEYKGPIESYY